MKSRNDFKKARIILIKVGTEVINAKDGFINLGIIANIVEQICRLYIKGKKIILVTSGAVGIGRRLFLRQHLLSGTIEEHINGEARRANEDFKAFAAAGQSEMQSLYENLFNAFHLCCSQILTSDSDFNIEKSRKNICNTINILLETGIIPIINENDVTSTREVPLIDSKLQIGWDNDSLAYLISYYMKVDLMIILSDIPGFYKRNKDGDLEIINEFKITDKIVPSNISNVGLTSQIDKLRCLVKGSKSNVIKSSIIIDARVQNCIQKLLDGEIIGTNFPRLSKSNENKDDESDNDIWAYIDPIYLKDHANLQS